MDGKLWQVKVWVRKSALVHSESWVVVASDAEIASYTAELAGLKKSGAIEEYRVVSAADAAKSISGVRKGVTILLLSGKP